MFLTEIRYIHNFTFEFFISSLINLMRVEQPRLTVFISFNLCIYFFTS